MPSLRRWFFQQLYRRWSPRSNLEDGYAIFLPSPMDMPFLLRFALEGLRHVDTTNCRQIIVIPDGWADDNGTALAEVVEEFDDSRVLLLRISRRDIVVVRKLPSPHWLTIIYGINAATAKHAFLHDSDAFFADAKGIEKIYQSMLDNNLETIGIEARMDPFFESNGYQIPGTWEMMFDLRWIRRWKPYHVRGQTYDTPHGSYAFDTLLYPQFAEYSGGGIGIMSDPPQFVHFHGTIVTYRTYRREIAQGRGVVDELYRLLLLSILEDVVPSVNKRKLLPSVEQLAAGLTDNKRPVHYQTETARESYSTFRAQLERLQQTSLFLGAPSERISELIRPFDQYHDYLVSQGQIDGQITGRFRSHGLS